MTLRLIAERVAEVAQDRCRASRMKLAGQWPRLLRCKLALLRVSGSARLLGSKVLRLLSCKVPHYSYTGIWCLRGHRSRQGFAGCCVLCQPDSRFAASMCQGAWQHQQEAWCPGGLLSRLSKALLDTCSAAACLARTASRSAPALRSSAPRAADAARSRSSFVGDETGCWLAPVCGTWAA